VIITDTLLARRQADGNPIRVALVGAGFIGRNLAAQITRHVPGMEVVVIVARRLEQAAEAFGAAGVESPEHVETAKALDAAIRAGRPAVTEDYAVATAADGVDVVVDVTGAVEYGAHVALSAFEHGKHLVLTNAEVDATVGPRLSQLADAAGVVYSGCDGDQPGAEMNLVRYIRGVGLTPLVCGNIKGLMDHYRTPTTQEGFAAKWGQNTWMVTSFADGMKISVEQAVTANATGMTVHQRGMLGRDHHGHVDELVSAYDVDELRAIGGAVDFVVGAAPGPGVYVLAANDDPRRTRDLELYKMGTGPLYSFYTPFHLCYFEVPTTIARAALLGDATIKPVGAHVEVIAQAKQDLAAGTVLDALGGYHYWGSTERAAVARDERLLPAGVVEGCTLLRDVKKDDVLTYDDVELPAGRLVDRLRTEQESLVAPHP